MKKNCLFLLCFLLILCSCGQKEKELPDSLSAYDTEESISGEAPEEASLPEADASPTALSLSDMLDEITSSVNSGDPEVFYNHCENDSIVYKNGYTYRIFSDGIYRRASGNEDWESLYQGEMSRNHNLELYRDFLYFTLNREGEDTKPRFVRQTLWQLDLNTLECTKIGDMVQDLPYIFSVYDGNLYIGYSMYSALRYDVYPLDEQGMPGEKLDETSPEFICAEQNAFSQAQEDNWHTGTTYSPQMQEMDQEVIPIPECTSMLNGYYLTRRPYTEALAHFYLVHAATGERQFLLDAYDIWAITPTGLYCIGDESSTNQLFYYSFSRKEALPVLYPALSYEIFQLLTYDPSWLYLYCDDSILRMSRSTGETEVLLDTIPEDVTFSYFAVDPEYFYMEDTMFPL